MAIRMIENLPPRQFGAGQVACAPQLQTAMRVNLMMHFPIFWMLKFLFDSIGTSEP